jgi:hypothetical protein
MEQSNTIQLKQLEEIRILQSKFEQVVFSEIKLKQLLSEVTIDRDNLKRELRLTLEKA